MTYHFGNTMYPWGSDKGAGTSLWGSGSPIYQTATFSHPGIGTLYRL